MDNLPEGADHIWMRKTFNKYGVVKDTFIHFKRSKRKGNRFGFVRYDCHVSASMAISKTNGMWIEDQKLFVKEAIFGHKEDLPWPKIPRSQGVFLDTSKHGVYNGCEKHHKEEIKEKMMMDGPSNGEIRGNIPILQGKSFAQVVIGTNGLSDHTHQRVVHSLPIYQDSPRRE